MSEENHFNSNAYDNVYENLKKIFDEQAPSCLFMFLIGVGATVTMMLSGDSVAGKSAATFLISLTSGLTQFKVFLSVAIAMLLISSIVKCSQNFSENGSLEEKTGFWVNMSNKGLFSFLVPYAALIFGIDLVMCICFLVNPSLFKSIESIKTADITMLFICSFMMILFSTLFYLASLIENIAKSKIVKLSVVFIYFVVLLITLFDIAK